MGGRELAKSEREREREGPLRFLSQIIAVINMANGKYRSLIVSLFCSAVYIGVNHLWLSICERQSNRDVANDDDYTHYDADDASHIN